MTLSRPACVAIVWLLFHVPFRTEISLGRQNTANGGKTAKMLVPFVGCKADGQAGPVDAPQAPKHRVELDVKVAQRLAIYEAEVGPLAIGPSGWSCLALYGSGGVTLYVTPGQLNDVFTSKWPGITGPGIAASSISGETSGRFMVAQVVARVFPKERSFVLGIIEAYGVPAKNYPFGPFLSDRLNYLNDHTVEYQTRSRSEGLGTLVGRFRPSDNAIRGVTILEKPGFDLRHLAVRLPQSLNDFTTIVIQQFERQK